MCTYERQSEARHNNYIVFDQNETFWKKFATMKEFICKKDQDDAQNYSNSLMHKFPMQKFDAFVEEGKTSVDDRENKRPVDEKEDLGCTRYYMPLYFD